MFPSVFINVDSDIPDVSDFINERLGNVFVERLGTKSVWFLHTYDVKSILRDTDLNLLLLKPEPTVLILQKFPRRLRRKVPKFLSRNIYKKKSIYFIYSILGLSSTPEHCLEPHVIHTLFVCKDKTIKNHTTASLYRLILRSRNQFKTYQRFPSIPTYAPSPGTDQYDCSCS